MLAQQKVISYVFVSGLIKFLLATTTGGENEIQQNFKQTEVCSLDAFDKMEFYPLCETCD